MPASSAILTGSLEAQPFENTQREHILENLERSIIATELVQRREEGCDVTDFEARVEAAVADEDTPDAVFAALYDELDQLVPEASFPL